MIYLEKFMFPDLDSDNIRMSDLKGSFFDDHTYPFHLTSEIGLWSLDFDPITILYGGNGSGKSTVINIISSKIGAERRSMFNAGPYFADFVDKCHLTAAPEIADSISGKSGNASKKYSLAESTTVLTSDDIFRHMLDLRQENDIKLHKSNLLLEEFINPGELPRHLNFETGYNVDKFIHGAEIRKARRGKGSTFNKLLTNRIGKMERGYSNGETALMKLSELIEKPGLYLLDEPENSMSCEFQIKLASIIQYLARYGNCQFIIATHSPFILAMEQAKIYNLDHNPVDISHWWELDNMKRYFSLFYAARTRFLKK